MKYLAAAGAISLALLLGGCTPSDLLPTPIKNLINTYGALTDASVPPAAVIVAGNSFDAVEVTAKNIVIACTPAARPAACNDVALGNLIKAVKAGRTARDGLEGFLADHPGQLGSKGLYDALQKAISTIQAAIAAYQGA